MLPERFVDWLTDAPEIGSHLAQIDDIPGTYPGDQEHQATDSAVHKHRYPVKSIAIGISSPNRRPHVGLPTSQISEIQA